MEFLSQCFTLFHKGGPVMYLMLLCSFLVVTITVERFIYYRNAATDTSAFIRKLQPLLERQRIGEAIQLCEQLPKTVSQVALQGLLAYQRGSQIENALESSATLTAAKLRQYLNYLSAIVTLSPLLGLLGTVVGMITTFSVLNMKAGQPMAITGGVGEALIATATGLTVAVLSFVVHVYFSHRVDSLITDMESVCAMVINFLPAKKAARRDSHEIA
ncbi:MotA/TolQ/ExbB proton channel family protein [Propionispora hippei]|uniref:Biopolymer transport protein ExbB n=1 Tax=Propionispora hippei DSM 15287 TaxID=1123003 RepID=A0A1M6KAK4_9FIRM|nr:MotA/TolQ/ExbB proton channel family protein [Propionispora hippei]SHJ55968.1 biopolymer transport protein ExbB [Propionispora hippei DSM 15287]